MHTVPSEKLPVRRTPMRQTTRQATQATQTTTEWHLPRRRTSTKNPEKSFGILWHTWNMPGRIYRYPSVTPVPYSLAHPTDTHIS